MSPLKQVCPQLAEPQSHIAYDYSRPCWISQGIAYDIRVQRSNCQALGRARAGIFPGVVAARVEYIMAPSKTVTTPLTQKITFSSSATFPAGEDGRSLI